MLLVVIYLDVLPCFLTSVEPFDVFQTVSFYFLLQVVHTHPLLYLM